MLLKFDLLPRVQEVFILRGLTLDLIYPQASLDQAYLLSFILLLALVYLSLSLLPPLLAF
jgi:hypothetical protein